MWTRSNPLTNWYAKPGCQWVKVTWQGQEGQWGTFLPPHGGTLPQYPPLLPQNTYPGKVGVYRNGANRTDESIVWSQSKSQMTDLWYVCVPFYFRFISALGTNPSAL